MENIDEVMVSVADEYEKVIIFPMYAGGADFDEDEDDDIYEDPEDDFDPYDDFSSDPDDD